MMPLTADQRELVRTHVAFASWTVRRFFPHLIRDPDAFQASCLGLCVAARRFDPSRGTTFRTYAAYAARQHVEIERERAVCPGTVTGFDFAPMPIREQEDLDARLDAATALALLTPAQREVLSLIYLEGLTASEAADRLGLSADRVKGLKDWAIAKIRRALPELTPAT